MSCRAFEETKEQLLKVEGHKALLEDPSACLLQAKLALRTPYITPLNILQVTIEFCISTEKKGGLGPLVIHFPRSLLICCSRWVASGGVCALIFHSLENGSGVCIPE